MGLKTGFFANDLDYRDFLAFAQATGFQGLNAIVPSGNTPFGALLPTEYGKCNAHNLNYTYLLPLHVPESAVVYDRNNPSSLGLAMSEYPIIEVCPSRQRGQTVQNGRIYFCMERGRAFYEDAKKGYEALARYLRKWDYAEGYKYRIGPATADEVKNGRLVLDDWY